MPTVTEALTENQRLFDVNAARDYLRSIGVTSATVSSTRRIFSQIPIIRIGKKLYASREALDSWIRNRQRRGQ